MMHIYNFDLNIHSFTIFAPLEGQAFSLWMRPLIIVVGLFDVIHTHEALSLLSILIVSL